MFNTRINSVIKIITLIVIVIISIKVNCDDSLLNELLLSPEPNIVNGENSPKYYTYIVSIQRKSQSEKSGFKHHCGGSILNKRFILTASHCLKMYSNNTILRIVAGIKNLDEQGSVHEMEYFIMHEHYNDTSHENDVAIIKVKEPIEYTNKIQAVVLSDEHIKGGTKALLTGWGYISNKKPIIPRPLQRLNFTTISNTRCSRAYPRKVFDSTICARAKDNRGKPASGCQGDSGGPLVTRDDLMQIGVVSFGTKPCAIGAPSAYARVSSFLDWIHEHSKDE